MRGQQNIKTQYVCCFYVRKHVCVCVVHIVMNLIYRSVYRVEKCFELTKIAARKATLFGREFSAYCLLLSAVLFSVSTLHYATNIGILDRINFFNL